LERKLKVARKLTEAIALIEKENAPQRGLGRPVSEDGTSFEIYQPVGKSISNQELVLDQKKPNNDYATDLAGGPVHLSLEE